MKSFKKIYLGVLLISFLSSLIIGFPGFLRTEAQVTPADNTTPPCFDYYPYAALDITSSLDKSSYNPGENANLTLSVTNQHPKTSLQNAAVIFQIRKSLPETNTSIVLYEIKLKEGLTYSVGQTQENIFSIPLPSYLSDGLYEGYIYITDNGYSIAGLSFTQDVLGAFVMFRIINSSQKDFITPYFEEEKALINGIIKANPFNPPPTIDENNLPANISIPIFNPSPKAVESHLDTTLYYWDESGEKINSFSKNLTLLPQQSYNFSYTSPESLKAGTYILKSALTSGEAMVTSKIRFSLSGFAPRIYYSGVAQEGGKNIFFTCVGNIADSQEGDELKGTIKLSALDQRQAKQIDELNYTGALFPTTQPALYQKELATAPDILALKTEIFDAAGNLIQQKEINYQFRPPQPVSTISIYFLIVLIILILVLLIAILVFFKFRKHSLPPLLLLGLVVFILAFSYFIINNKSNPINQPSAARAAASPYNPQGFSNNWSGEINRYRVRKGWWGFVYANMGIDFMLPEMPIEPGENFEIFKGNSGSYYTIFKSYDSPPFWFTPNMILGSKNIDLTSQVSQVNDLDSRSQVINGYIAEFENYFRRAADEIAVVSASSTITEQVGEIIKPINEWTKGIKENTEEIKDSAQEANKQPYETVWTTKKVSEVAVAANNVAYFTDYLIQAGADMLQLISKTSYTSLISEFKDQLNQLDDANSDLGKIIKNFENNPDNIVYSYADEWITPNFLISFQTKDAIVVQARAASNITRPITTILTLNRTFKFPGGRNVTISQTHPISIVPVGSPIPPQPIPPQPIPEQPILRVSPSLVVMFKDNVKEFFAYFDPDGLGPLIEVDVTHIPETQWTSLNPDIVQILSTTSGPSGGKEVKALKSGNARIKVVYGIEEGYADITVKTIKIKEVPPY